MSYAAAIGTFDGVHVGHRRVIETALGTGLPVRVVTLHPHPRSVVQGNLVELVCSLERRVELLRELGVEEWSSCRSLGTPHASSRSSSSARILPT